MQEHTENEGDKMKHSKWIEGAWFKDSEGLTIWRGPEFTGMKICDIRGWGYLTGKGSGALGLPESEAVEIQNTIANLLTAAPDMLEALEQAKVFAEWVLCVSKPEVEMYKHEFQASAYQSIERLDKAIDKARGEA